MKKARTSEYYHREADLFARLALSDKTKGESGRVITFYEYALNFELQAINTCEEEATTSPQLLGLYQNAISYALECGRINKAKHLIEAVLARNPPPDMVVVFEELMSRM
jgi:tetratricopeptide (TPR) repeat protein